MKGRKCVIKILLIVMVFCFGFVGFFLCYQMAQKSDEDQPFRLNPQLSLDPTLAITDHSECSDVDSCGQLGDHLAEMLFGEHEDAYWTGAREAMMTFEPENFEYFDEYKELEATEAFDNEEGYEEASEEEFLLAKYAITDDEIALLERNSFSDDEEEWARFIWSDFSTIIPLAWRQQLRYYKVYSGSDTAAYIGSEPTQGSRWERFWRPETYQTFAVDTLHFSEDDTFSILTMIHEFAHLFSLDSSQYGNQLFCYLPFTYECFEPGSYLQNFYTQFWRYVPSVWVDKEDLSSRAQKAFYERNHSAFLNEYASSNPHEDFAESFTWFIISPSSVLDEKSPVDQKALFFYQYPELVSLRLQILQNLAALLVSSNE